MAQPHSFGRFLSVVLATFALTSVTCAQTTPSAQNAAQAASKEKAAVPVTMTECEGVNNCATWTFLGKQGNGQWPSGEVANLSVESLDGDNVVIRRADSTGSSTGLTAVYKGTRHGDRVGGEFTSSWPGHWDNKAGNWYATIGQSTQSPPSVMHWCAAACRTWIWTNGHYVVQGDTANSQVVTVESFTRDSVIMHRTDTGQYPGTAILTGTISSDGNRIINGTIAWTSHPGLGLSSGAFNAAWGAAINSIPGGDPPGPGPRLVARPVVCFPWFFLIVCQ
ncbi:MAG TPA: hypothetical protein VMT20_02010 [Terriglobia bacterium]|nr:hypothetical protein [Terriglobia bacterium]